MLTAGWPAQVRKVFFLNPDKPYYLTRSSVHGREYRYPSPGCVARRTRPAAIARPAPSPRGRATLWRPQFSAGPERAGVRGGRSGPYVRHFVLQAGHDAAEEGCPRFLARPGAPGGGRQAARHRAVQGGQPGQRGAPAVFHELQGPPPGASPFAARDTPHRPDSRRRRVRPDGTAHQFFDERRCVAARRCRGA